MTEEQILTELNLLSIDSLLRIRLKIEEITNAQLFSNIAPLIIKHIDMVKSQYDTFIEITTYPEVDNELIFINISNKEIEKDPVLNKLICSFLEEYQKNNIYTISWGINYDLEGDNFIPFIQNLQRNT